MTKGGALLPRHCSYRLGWEVTVSREFSINRRASSKRVERHEHLLGVVVALQCHGPGVAWRGLFPLLFQAPFRVAGKALQILIAKFSSSAMVVDPSLPPAIAPDHNTTDSHYFRLFDAPILLYIIPPTTHEVDYSFSGRLIHNEHLFLQAQTLAAWYATLGGGYFLCHKLSTAVQLARRQRRVAEWMGDEEMADRCTLNEAYNYIHAGYFGIAFSMLTELQKSARSRQDVVLLNMCKSARLFGKRMRRAGKRLASQASSVDDDYQRIRIVEKL